MNSSKFQKNNSTFEKEIKVNSSQQYVALVIKEIKRKRSDFVIQTKPAIQLILRKYATDASLILQMKKNPHRKQQILFQILQQLKADNQTLRYGDYVKQFIKQKMEEVSSIPTRQATFITDCFRECMSFPIKKQHQNTLYNFLSFYKKNLNKQLRRVLWQKLLMSQKTKQAFFKYDHQVTPYNIDMEFRIALDRLAQIQEIRLKENQRDIAIRLLEFVIKSTGQLPNRNHVFLIISLIQLFSFYGPNKSLQVGSIYCGLVDLANYYYEPMLDKRLINILKAVELIDEESYQLIITYFFSQELQYSSRQQLNQIYEHFRLSLGSKYLGMASSQYLIDQILIKKRSRFDMYVLFAMTIMILGEQIQQFLKQQPKKIQNKSQQIQPALNNSQVRVKISLKNVFQKSKLIKLEDVMNSYQILYQKIPPIYSNQNLPQEPNKLFQHLLAFEGQYQQQNEKDNRLGNSEEQIGQEDSDFVQTSKQKYRLGKKQGWMG